MKIKFLFLASLCMLTLFSAQTSAQTKTKTTTRKTTTRKTTTQSTSSSGLTTAGANQIIKFNNGVGAFFKTYFNLDHTSSFYTNVMIGLQERGKKSRTTLVDEYRRQEGFDYSLEKFNSYEASSDLTDPTKPPTVIGNKNVEFFNQKWSELKTAYQACLDKHNVILGYLDSDLELKNKSDEKALLNQLEEYKNLVISLYNIQDQIFEKTYELGDMAEEVTLAKHPMKREILDLRKALRVAQVLQTKTQNAKSLSEIDQDKEFFVKSDTELKDFLTKYANYDPAVGATPQIKYMKAAVVDFKTRLAEFEVIIKDLIDQNTEKSFDVYQRSLDSRFNLMVSSYKSFIQRNNNY